MLPLIYPLKKTGTYTEYSHKESHHAIVDFCEQLPAGKADYLSAMGKVAQELYEKASDENVTYFLDKTPRYHLICEQIMEAFPDGKFIFLWRNPLAVINSCIQTWGHGKWNVWKHKIDLFEGAENLCSTFKAYQNRAIAIQYEQLISTPERVVEDISNYLEIDFSSRMIKEFSSVQLEGQMGDPTGVTRYRSIIQDSLDKWKLGLRGSHRKKWCRAYLEWLGLERLYLMGYELQNLLDDLNSLPNQWWRFLPDMSRDVFGFLVCIFQPVVLLRNWESSTVRRLKKLS